MVRYPFPPHWIGIELPDYRWCDSTYCRYDYRTLPRFRARDFDGSFSWLRHQPSPLGFDSHFSSGWSPQSLKHWRESSQQFRQNLLLSARELGVSIPESMLTFLLDVELVSRVRSPTDCYFTRSTQIIVNPGPQRGHFLHFMSDSQSCFEWYLYFDPGGKDRVVATSADLSDPKIPMTFWECNHEEIVVCGSSFESFIYRLWIENEAWYRLEIKDQPMTPAMREYLELSKQTKEILE